MSLSPPPRGALTPPDEDNLTFILISGVLRTAFTLPSGEGIGDVSPEPSSTVVLSPEGEATQNIPRTPVQAIPTRFRAKGIVRLELQTPPVFEHKRNVVISAIFLDSEKLRPSV